MSTHLSKWWLCMYREYKRKACSLFNSNFVLPSNKQLFWWWYNPCVHYRPLWISVGRILLICHNILHISQKKLALSHYNVAQLSHELSHASRKECYFFLLVSQRRIAHTTREAKWLIHRQAMAARSCWDASEITDVYQLTVHIEKNGEKTTNVSEYCYSAVTG